MSRLRTFLGLAGAERRLLLAAFGLVGMVRVGLWLVPFGVFCRHWSALIGRTARNGRTGGLAPQRIVWLVSVAGRYVPDARCLTRSFAAQLLLAQHGHRALLQIGVRKQGKDLDAHAWLELGGEPLFERDDHLRQFNRLTAIDPWPATPDRVP